MRTLLLILIVGLSWSALASESRAQYPYGVYRGGFAVNPYYYPPAYSGFGGYASPYGYRSSYNFGGYPGPWGYNTYYNYSTFVRPYVAGPFHSVIYNPFTLGYQYTPGYLNAPFFFYGY